MTWAFDDYSYRLEEVDKARSFGCVRLIDDGEEINEVNVMNITNQRCEVKSRRKNFVINRENSCSLLLFDCWSNVIKL